MTAPKVIWAEPGMPGYTDEPCASYTVRYTRADAPELLALVESVRRQSAWVRSALDCDAWKWDADQREIAESEHAEAIAALSAYEALQ